MIFFSVVFQSMNGKILKINKDCLNSKIDGIKIKTDTFGDGFDLEKEEELNNWCLERVGKEKFKKGSLRLERMLCDSIREIAKTRKIKIVTVAGTNGKGETCYTLSHLLKKAGVHHALWISPHVMSIRERISFDGELISYEKLKDLLESEYERACSIGEKVSYYELMLCVFVKYVLSFDNDFLKVLILEVGIGGRIDGVNLFDADLTAITSISRDHQDLLGVGYKKILFEKLGITRVSAPLVTNFELEYLREITRNFVEDFAKDFSREREKGSFNWIDLFEVAVSKKEDNFSKRNRRLAYVLFKILEQLEQDGKNAREVVDQINQQQVDYEKIPFFKGRNEELDYFGAKFVFIGSHNLDGVRKLLHFANRADQNERFDYALIALSKRSYEEEPFFIFKLFAGNSSLAQKIIFTSFEHTKAFHFSSDFFKKFSDSSGIEKDSLQYISYIEDWESFVTNKEELQGKRVLVTGSYYFVGTVQTYLFNKV
ncbi:MAG: hypothetical protein HQK49_00905 [Oligoflexia bacterium]|nr:hypothetical protein [Oligoflexia bacterium]